MQPAKDDVILAQVLSAIYNAGVNVFWSVLAFAPVSIFCFRLMERAWLWAFVAASAIAMIMPASMLRYVALSSAVTTYRRLGVHWVNHFVQHGTLINRWVRRRYPEYQRVRFRTRIPHLLESTYLQGRFHWTVLLFFLLSSLYAVRRRHPVWALLITIMNVVYNLYPIWLQQYIRVRVNPILFQLGCTQFHHDSYLVGILRDDGRKNFVRPGIYRCRDQVRYKIGGGQ